MPFGGLLTVGLIGAGTNLFGGLIGSNAAKSAAGTQAAAGKQVAGMATDAATGAQKGIGAATTEANTGLDSAYQEEIARLLPYMTAGNQGLSSLESAISSGAVTSPYGAFSAPTGVTEQNDPGYQFRLEQGQKALDNSAAARGEATGGAAMKAAERYGQGFASNEYSNVFNRALGTYGTNRDTFQGNQANLYNRLMGLAGIGQNAANSANTFSQLHGSGLSSNLMGGAEYSGNVGLQGAQIAGNALTGAANAQAAGTVGSANAWSNALGGIGGTASNLLMLNNLMGPQNNSGYGAGTPGNPGYQPIGTMNEIQ